MVKHGLKTIKANLKKKKLAEASEEGLGSKGAVVPMTMMMICSVTPCILACGHQRLGTNV